MIRDISLVATVLAVTTGPVIAQDDPPIYIPTTEQGLYDPGAPVQPPNDSLVPDWFERLADITVRFQLYELMGIGDNFADLKVYQWSKVPENYREWICPNCKPDHNNVAVENKVVILRDDAGPIDFLAATIAYQQVTRRGIGREKINTTFATGERRFLIRKYQQADQIMGIRDSLALRPETENVISSGTEEREGRQ